MKLFNLAILLMALGVLLVAPFAVADPVNSTVTQVGSQERWDTGTAGTVATEGGNITAVNISGSVITSKWAGFYGNVSGSIVLGDSSGNHFYKWTVSDVTGAFVYAATDAVTDWTTLSPLYADDTIFATHSFLIEGSDSFNYTFVNQESVKIPKSATSEQNFNYTTTWQGNSQGYEFKTYAAKANGAGGTALVWVGMANATKTAFNSQTVDYQILAGVTDQQNPVTFYFYLELP